MRLAGLFAIGLVLSLHSLHAESPPVRTQLAQTTAIVQTYDLASLQELALANNPSIREADARVQAARGRCIQAGLRPNPVVGYSGQQIGSRGLAEQQGVFLGQEFVTGGKLALDRSAVGAEISRLTQNLEAQRQRVLTDVAIGYYESLAAQTRLQTTSKLVEIGEKSAASVQRLVEASEVSKVDLLQAKIEVQNVHILRTTATNRAQAAWRSLASVVGRPDLSQQEVGGSLSEVPKDFEWEASLQRLLGQSPELAAAQADAERARWLHQRAIKQNVPNVNVAAVIQRDEGVNLTDGNLQITVPLPITNRNQGGIRETHANIAVAEQAIERIQLSLERRLATVFERYSTASQQVERYEEQILPASVEQLELVEHAFQAGEIGYLSLLTAQRTYFQTNLAYIDAQRDRAVAASEIQGLLLTDSLSPLSSGSLTD